MTSPRIDNRFDPSGKWAVREDATFLSARQYLSLATSRKKLLRADESGAAVRGLFDPETGERFLIQAKELTSAWPQG